MVVGKEVRSVRRRPAAVAQAPKAGEDERGRRSPRGSIADQIAELAEEGGPEGRLRGRQQESRASTPASTEPTNPPNLEGFLFPATYELPKKATSRTSSSASSRPSRHNIAEVDLAYAESKNLNVYDVLKIASMIEREVQVAEERRLARR